MTSPIFEDRYLSPKAVTAKTSLSRTTLWRLVRRGDFPAPARLSDHRIAYSEAAVNAWLAGRAVPITVAA